MTAADARARGYRSAWSDAEYVRLAMERSWWDETTGPVVRSTSADAQDPWLTAEKPAVASQDAGTGAAA
jgi:hypothetical protein